MIQASGQASWADLVWVETLEHMEGQHVTSSSSVDLDMKWGCSLTAGTCRQLYHCMCFITPWDMDIVYHNLLWVTISYSFTIDCINEQLITWRSFLSVNLYHFSFLSLSTASTMGSLLSSIRLSGLLASSTRPVALCMPVNFFWEQPLQIAFHAGQLSWPGGCEQVQLGHCEVDFCGLFFWGWWPWWRVWMALPAHIASAPDSMV